VPLLECPITVPRNDTQIVVTEYGWTDLRGKSASERATSLIQLAHPDFRDGLTENARKMSLL
jgi:itaconate CoA-transferase